MLMGVHRAAMDLNPVSGLFRIFNPITMQTVRTVYDDTASPCSGTIFFNSALIGRQLSLLIS